MWDIADGLLAGAVQYWLYSRQPCSDPECEECMTISTAEGRLEELRKLMNQFAEESEYFHSPTIATSVAPEIRVELSACLVCECACVIFRHEFLPRRRLIRKAAEMQAPNAGESLRSSAHHA